MANSTEIDVLVIGGGTAAFEAAVAARQAGAPKVVMLEKAPEDEFGGNARFSHTGFRFVHAGAQEMREFLPNLDDATFRALNPLPMNPTPSRFCGMITPGKDRWSGYRARMASSRDLPRAFRGGVIPSQALTVGAASMTRAVGSRCPPTPGPMAHRTVRMSGSMLGKP